MGLLNDVKAAEKAETPVAVNSKKAERKAKAKERKAAKAEALTRVLDYVKQLKDVPAGIAEDIKTLTVAVREGGFAPSVTPELLFGADAKPGAKITALDVFQKFHKGFPEMRKYMKKWAEKGTIVELDPKTQSYVLK